MRKNANEIIFDEIIVLGTPALFTDWRVDRASVPTDMKMYEVRHADEDWGDPCQLARGIFVDFYGTRQNNQFYCPNISCHSQAKLWTLRSGYAALAAYPDARPKQPDSFPYSIRQEALP